MLSDRVQRIGFSPTLRISAKAKSMKAEGIDVVDLSVGAVQDVIEDDIRDKERAGAFDERFIELARAVYVTNDERAAIKRRINTRLGSTLVEEKSYADYKR